MFFLLALLGLPAAPEADTCTASLLLPAYSHNDYRNRRPLFDALALGYRGAEADVFRVGTELIVGHARSELRASRTLARLYLEPLRDRQRACGHILADSTPFFLNVELKEPDSEAFCLFLAQLQAYEELFHSPSPGLRPNVQVTLVGWWPSPDSTPSSWPDYLRIQLAVAHEAAGPESSDVPLVGLVSVDYGKVLGWRGQGDVPPAAEAALARARALAAALAAPIRVHHAPALIGIYCWLLSEGVTLIGANDLTHTQVILQGLSGQER